MIRSVVVALWVIFADAAAAQGAPRLDPHDPKTPVPAVTYRSAFEGYRSYAEPELAPWRKANEEAGAAGGHAGIFKPPAKPPSEKGHGGHK